MNDLVMPKLGLTMTEGVVAEWRVKPGDDVAQGDILLVVETDKIANEVEAPASGRIAEILVEAGTTVEVGVALARWSGPSANVDAAQDREPAPPVEEAAPADPDSAIAARPDPSGRIVATPLARRIAARNDVDLAAVAGSGPRGRVKAADVEDAIQAARAQPEPGAVAAETSEAVTRVATRSQRVAAARMAEAKGTIPHFYLGNEVDITRLTELRREFDSEAESGRSPLTLTHFVLAACAKALADIAGANARWADGDIAPLPTVDIGIATQTESGLLVPMVRNLSPAPSLVEIAKRMDAVVGRARAGEAKPDDFGGGALTISNLGMHGVSWVVPIINPPQSAILGVGRGRAVFRPDADGAPVPRQELGLFLAADHRVHDGVSAARLLARVSDYLSKPLRLLSR